MAFIPEQRMALYCGIPFMIVCLLFYRATRNKARKVEHIEKDRYNRSRKFIILSNLETVKL